MSTKWALGSVKGQRNLHDYGSGMYRKSILLGWLRDRHESVLFWTAVTWLSFGAAAFVSGIQLLAVVDCALGLLCLFLHAMLSSLPMSGMLTNDRIRKALLFQILLSFVPSLLIGSIFHFLAGGSPLSFGILTTLSVWPLLILISVYWRWRSLSALKSRQSRLKSPDHDRYELETNLTENELVEYFGDPTQFRASTLQIYDDVRIGIAAYPRGFWKGKLGRERLKVILRYCVSKDFGKGIDRRQLWLGGRATFQRWGLLEALAKTKIQWDTALRQAIGIQFDEENRYRIENLESEAERLLNPEVDV